MDNRDKVSGVAKSAIRKRWALLLVFLVAVATRLVVLHANMAAFDGDMPFTLESAIQFRMTERVYSGEGIPRHEPGIQYPEGIQVFRTDTVMAEYVYAFLAKLLPDSIPLSTRVRWIMVVWFSLGAAMLFVWVREWSGSWMGGLMAGLLYAVSLSSVIRSSGLEVSRENFAIPFLIAHLALDAMSRNRSNGTAVRCAIGSAFCLGLALTAWDMIQFYVLIWSGLFWLRSVRGHLADRAEAQRWIFPALAVIGASVLSPYHRLHGLWVSPALLLIYGALLVRLLDRISPATSWSRWLVAASPWLIVLLLPSGYIENYGHFGELLWAKIRFLNQKPVDPALLTFNQRIMWVPALDSLTWPLTNLLFPSTFFLILLIGIAVLGQWFSQSFRSAWAQYRQISQNIVFLTISLLAFVLFVRFHVYVSIFVCAWAGMFWAVSRHHPVALRVIVRCLLLVVLLVEAHHVWAQPHEWGRPNVYHREMAEVIEWFQEYGDGAPVLANFGASASLWAYANVPVILHPKFETPEIRARVQTYGEALFLQDERTFRDWADQHGAVYYVHALGEFAGRSPELQMRYFVNALTPPPDAAARTFEFAPETARGWEWLEGNRKYRIFRIISRADEESADLLTLEAIMALQRGDLDAAERYAWNALSLLPSQYRAQEVVARVASLRESGFEYRPERVDDE